MMKKQKLTTVSLLLLFTFAFPAEAKKANRADLLKRLEAGCMESLKKETKRKAVCDCVARGADKKLDLSELEIVARAYEGDEKAERAIEKEEALSTFDAELAESCLEDPDFSVEEE